MFSPAPEERNLCRFEVPTILFSSKGATQKATEDDVPLELKDFMKLLATLLDLVLTLIERAEKK